MKQKLLILLLGAYTIGCAPQEKIYHASEFGIYPNSEQDISPLVAKALETIKSESSKRTHATLKFENGFYHLFPDSAQIREYYISNHDQDNPKSVGIAIEDINNFTFDGGGSDFYINGRMLPMSITGTNNCKITNLSFDNKNPQIAQVEIIENDTKKGEITYKVAPWVEYEIINGRFITYGSNWKLHPTAGIAFDKESRHLIYNTSDIGVGTSNVEELEPRIIKAPWRNDKLQPSTIVAFRGWQRPTPGIFLSHNKSTILENVTVHYAEGMGLLAQVSEDITLTNFNVSLRGEDDPRYFTTQADATHFSGCKGAIISTDGLYEGMMDDAINVHGTYLKIKEVIDTHTVIGEYMHPQAYGFEWGMVGDSVQFVASNTMELTDEKNAIKAIAPHDKSEIKGAKEYKITFTSPIEKRLSDGNAYGIENLEWTPEVVFADNIIRNNRARGTLFSTPKLTIIENNLFDHTSGTAILLCGDCNGWYETGACREVIIRNNRFINSLTNMFQFTNAIISIYPEIPNLNNQTKYFHGGKEGAITIENNIFETFDNPIVYAKSINGLTFKNNTIIKNNDYEPFHWNKEPFLLERAINVVIDVDNN
ncbi:MAG: alpha-1,3-galactosidase B [Rikenellaceae bacterium]